VELVEYSLRAANASNPASHNGNFEFFIRRVHCAFQLICLSREGSSDDVDGGFSDDDNI
jgi:hypothetical protein